MSSIKALKTSMEVDGEAKYAVVVGDILASSEEDAIEQASKDCRDAKPSSHRRRRRDISISTKEMLALLNSLRIHPDRFGDIEDGAGVERGTLDRLEARMKAALY